MYNQAHGTEDDIEDINCKVTAIPNLSTGGGTVLVRGAVDGTNAVTYLLLKCSPVTPSFSHTVYPGRQ